MQHAAARELRHRVKKAVAEREERRERVLMLFEHEPVILNVRGILRRLDDPDFSHSHVCIAVSELMSRGHLASSIEGIRLVRR